LKLFPRLFPRFVFNTYVLLRLLQSVQAETSADKALDKNGRPLVGAAKTAFIKKCEAEGK
jgi:hypothetical protein